MSGDGAGGVGAIRPLLGDVRIGTGRLMLRPLHGADAPALADELADIAVTRWLARVPHPYTLADARNFADHVRLAALAGTALTLAVTLRVAGDRPIGVVAIHGLDGVPEFGYWLGRAHWGRGLMGEAAGAMLGWVETRLAPRRIQSGAFVGNTASLAIQRRLGFVEVGRSRRPCLALGRLVDHIDTERAGTAPARS